MGLFFRNPHTNPHQSLPLKEKLKNLDLLSTLVFVPSIVSLLLALEWGGSKYGWGNRCIIVLLALCGVLVGVFVWLQRRGGDDALLPPRIIGQRSILSGMWFVFCNSSALSVIDYYVGDISSTQIDNPLIDPTNANLFSSGEGSVSFEVWNPCSPDCRRSLSPFSSPVPQCRLWLTMLHSWCSRVSLRLSPLVC